MADARRQDEACYVRQLRKGDVFVYDRKRWRIQSNPQTSAGYRRFDAETTDGKHFRMFALSPDISVVRETRR